VWIILLLLAGVEVVEKLVLGAVLVVLEQAQLF
jgi:hypothetical protein